MTLNSLKLAQASFSIQLSLNLQSLRMGIIGLCLRRLLRGFLNLAFIGVYLLYFLLGSKMNSHRHVERFKWGDIKRARDNGHSIASVKPSSLRCSFPVPQKSFFVTIKILCRAHVTKMFTAQQMHYLKVYPTPSSVCSTALHTVIWIHHLL